MAQTGIDGRAGLGIAAPLAMVLVGLFFMPWLEVSCAVGGPGLLPIDLPVDSPGAVDTSNLPRDAKGRLTLGKVSGWQLARGEFDATAPIPEQQQVPSPCQPEIPRSRTWAYAGLVLPALTALIAIIGLCGRLSTNSAGKWVALLGFLGVCMCFAVWQMDYVVDDVLTEFEDQLEASGANFNPMVLDQGLEEIREQLAKVIVSRPTPQFWLSGGLYLALLVCGFVASALRDPSVVVSDSDEAVNWRADVLQPAAAGPSPAAAPPALHGTQTMASPGFPPQTGTQPEPAAMPQERRAEEDLISFGEDLPPDPHA